MGDKLSVELSKIRQIIESEVDDNNIRQKVGAFILQNAAEQNKEIDLLLNTKMVKCATEGSDNVSISAKCCRGRM